MHATAVPRCWHEQRGSVTSAAARESSWPAERTSTDDKAPHSLVRERQPTEPPLLATPHGNKQFHPCPGHSRPIGSQSTASRPLPAVPMVAAHFLRAPCSSVAAGTQRRSTDAGKTFEGGRSATA